METCYNTEPELYEAVEALIKKYDPPIVQKHHHATNSGGWYVNKDNRAAIWVSSTLYQFINTKGEVTHILMEKIVNNRQYSITFINHSE